MKERRYTVIGYLTTKIGLPIAKRKLRERRERKQRRTTTGT